jgi:hypothetical protein
MVIVAAGNDGNAAALRNPAVDPFVIAVGATENDSSQISGIASFSNCGTSERFVDIVAPGRSLLSLRSPGSYADQHYPEGADFKCQGTGSLDLNAAKKARSPKASSADQTYQESDGTGSLEAARGGNHVYDEGFALEGEIDMVSSPWVGYCSNGTCAALCGMPVISTVRVGAERPGAAQAGAAPHGAATPGPASAGSSSTNSEQTRQAMST